MDVLFFFFTFLLFPLHLCIPLLTYMSAALDKNQICCSCSVPWHQQYTDVNERLVRCKRHWHHWHHLCHMLIDRYQNNELSYSRLVTGYGRDLSKIISCKEWLLSAERVQVVMVTAAVTSGKWTHSCPCKCLFINITRELVFVCLFTNRFNPLASLYLFF